MTEEQLVEAWLEKMGLTNSVNEDQRQTLAAFATYVRATDASNSQPVARVTITKPGDSLTGMSFLSLNDYGRATLGKGRHLLYSHPPGALYTMDQMREYAAAFHKSRVEASGARPECVDCGDSIEAHDPGTCGNCHSIKYARGAQTEALEREHLGDAEQRTGIYAPKADDSKPTTPCECRACLKGKTVDTGFGPMPVEMTRMIVCATCGNKRCPHANDHRNACTNSNEPGQPGSAY